MANIWKLAVVAGFLGSLVASVSGEYQGGKPHREVVQLDGTSFHDAIKDPANPLWFLKFYAPW